MIDYNLIEYNKKKYYVIDVHIDYNKCAKPLVINENCLYIVQYINNLYDNIYYNSKFQFYYIITKKNIKISFCKLFIKKYCKDNNIEYNTKIGHINKINGDLRIENIDFNNEYNNYYKTSIKVINNYEIIKKKEVDKKDVIIPKYVYFDKSNNRFIIRISTEIKLYSTSSKKYSIYYKLEECKKYLRDLKEENEELFDKYNIENIFSSSSLDRKLYKSFVKIINKSNYKFVHNSKKINILIVNFFT